MTREIAPVTPGELLNEEFLQPMGITQYRLAKEIGVSQRRISEIVSGRRRITLTLKGMYGRCEVPHTGLEFPARQSTRPI